MQHYRERLWPAPWMLIAAALVIPASLLVFLPINATAGIAVAIGLYAGCVILMVAASPIISVTDSELIAGKARIPLAVLGSAAAYSGQDATHQRGPGLDARAWLVIRGWVDPVVRVDLNDPLDPTPYWLISSRRPHDLVAVIAQARSARSAPTN